MKVLILSSLLFVSPMALALDFYFGQVTKVGEVVQLDQQYAFTLTAAKDYNGTTENYLLILENKKRADDCRHEAYVSEGLDFPLHLRGVDSLVKTDSGTTLFTSDKLSCEHINNDPY